MLNLFPILISDIINCAKTERVPRALGALGYIHYGSFNIEFGLLGLLWSTFEYFWSFVMKIGSSSHCVPYRF